MGKPRRHGAFCASVADVCLVKTRMRERSTRASSSPLLSAARATTMEKLLTVVCVSSLLLAALADDASSRSSLQHPSLGRLQDRVLGRKGGAEPAHHHHYRREGEHEEQHEVVPMEAERAEERKKRSWRSEDEDAVATEGLISSADYSGVAMHGHSSPPAHKKHPRP
ncbi:hypothetical protein ACQJBY_018279 [Aegilops geniculata]